MREWRHEIQRRLAGARLRPEREAEIVDEVTQHLDDRYRERVAIGEDALTAEARAWRELEEEGVFAREIERAIASPRPLPAPGAPANGWWLRSLGQDLRYAIRRLRQQPLFALTAIATIALSVGPTTAVIGVADQLFFRPVPGVVASDRLLNISFGTSIERDGVTGLRPWFVSYANVAEILDGTKSISDMTGVQQLSAGLGAGTMEPRRVQGQSVSANYFELLGVRIAAGRGFLREEDASPGGVASVVLAARLAHEIFGSPQAALGQRVELNSEPFTVVGVADAAFEGVSDWRTTFWITGMAYRRLTHWPPDKWAYTINRGPFYDYIARIAPGASANVAAAELRARGAALADVVGEGRDLFKTVGPILRPGLGAPRTLNKTGYAAVRMLGAVTLVLVLLGMANVANLLIFRGLKTGRDVAIRKALGASAGRLIQLMLVESLLLALTGAAAGVGVALGIQELLSDLSLWGIGAVRVPIDWRVLIATVAVAVITGVGFGIGPALLAARGSLLAAMGRGLRSDGPRAARLRQALAAVQLALSMTLLVGALLFLTTLWHLHAVDLGFSPQGVTTMGMDLRSHGYDLPRTLAYQRELLSRLQREPGLEHVAITYGVPVSGGTYTSRMMLAGQDPKTMAQEVVLNGATAQIFDALRLRIVQGRRFTVAEQFDLNSPGSPVVLTDVAARRLFGDVDPIGQTVIETPRSEHTVIGIAADVRWDKVNGEPTAVAFQPWAAFGLDTSSATVVARSSRPPDEVARAFRAAAARVDPNVPLFAERTMTEVIDRQLARQRLFAWVLGLLGAIGFLLAAVGLHGLISQMVAERSREIGIRMAVGADAGRVLRLVVRQAATVAAVGVIVGLGAAVATGRLVESELFGVSSRDPLVYAASAGLLVVVVAIALIGPARTATSIDPITVLRVE